MNDVEIRRILVPTDLTVWAEAAFPMALKLALGWDATIDLLYVIEPVVLPGEAGMTPIPSGSLELERVASAEQHLAQIAESAHFSGVSVEFTVGLGRASSYIMAHATSTGADMIVIATRGRRGLDHFLFGSTTERVVREATVPVLTVRPKAGE